jgi:hypothetical protein
MLELVTFALLAKLLVDWAGNDSLKTLSDSTIRLLSQRGVAKSPKDKLDLATSWYRTERLVFVLGAGASAAYGLPTWNTLLQKLLLTTLRPPGNEAIEETAEIDVTGLLARTFTSVFEPSPLISARYLEGHFREHNPSATLAFENSIRAALYAETTIGTESELLKEIRQYCIAAGRSPNIDSIITYNYDDLLERCLANMEIDIPFSPIYARGMKHKSHELPIYHVHGYLPSTGNLTTKNKIVLSEDGYHRQYLDTYGWSNLVQINKYKDHNCIFVGLSFTDPNLRRVLDIAKNERGDSGIHHLCFRKHYVRAEVHDRLRKLLSENLGLTNGIKIDEIDTQKVADELAALVENIEEVDAASFGVGVHWIDTYDDIPKALRTIRLAAQN